MTSMQSWCLAFHISAAKVGFKGLCGTFFLVEPQYHLVRISKCLFYATTLLETTTMHHRYKQALYLHKPTAKDFSCILRPKQCKV